MTGSIGTRDRLRVLFAIGSLGCGGSERQLINILSRLDRQRFEPQLYLIDRAGEFLGRVPDDVPVTAFSDVASAPGFYIPGRIARQQTAHLTAVLRAGNYDLLYDRTFLLPLISATAARRAGVPHVSTIVANPASDLKNNLHRFRWLKTRILTRAYRDAASVVAVSKALREAAIQYYGLQPDAVTTIPNGFDFDLIRQLAAQPGPSMPEDHFHLVSVGRLQREKGCRLLLEAVRDLVERHGHSQLQCWLIGDGPDRPSLQRFVDENDLGDHVVMQGYVENPYSILSRADLFCLPSSYEGMPNALIEALACGVPVVATDCPHGPREILEDGRHGMLVPPCDRNALVEALHRAIEQANSPTAQRDAARESIEQRYGIQSVMAILEEHLERVATGKR